MNVEIVSIGTEILLGEIVDTNSASLARQLRDIGANIYFMTTVGDNRARIADALRTALGRADVVITTGGLGPTVDDVTRQGVADATNRKLEFRPELLAEIAERFRLFGSKMSDNNRVQAYIPAGSIPVYNRLGTAPCFIVEAAAGTIISLPGVPREMRDILAATVIPYLRERMGGKGIIKARVLRTAGIGESSLDSQIGDLMTASNPTVGLAAHTGQTDIRITARADSEAEADTLIAEAEAAIRERVGEHIYGVGEEKLETVFARQLNERGFSLAVSYTGPPGRTIIERLREEGLTFRAVTETELGALLARLDRPADTDPADLDFRELSAAEADRLQAATGADVVIAAATHAAGTGIAVLTPYGARRRRYRFGGAETGAPIWAGTWGIGMAWRLLREGE
jgi:nicotinamide-nucleotide amidase